MKKTYQSRHLSTDIIAVLRVFYKDKSEILEQIEQAAICNLGSNNSVDHLHALVIEKRLEHDLMEAQTNFPFRNLINPTGGLKPEADMTHREVTDISEKAMHIVRLQGILRNLRNELPQQKGREVA